MLKGKANRPNAPLELGMLDEIVDGDVVEHAVAFAHRIVNDPSPQAPRKRRISEREAIIADDLPLQAGPFVVAQAHKMVPPEDERRFRRAQADRRGRGGDRAARFRFGLAREARLFDELVRSAPSAALRHVFFAERELAKIPGLAAGRTAAGRVSAGVVGAGTMGTRHRDCVRASRHSGRRDRQRTTKPIERREQTVMGMFTYQVRRDG